MSDFERDHSEFYMKYIKNISNELKLIHGDDIYPIFSKKIAVDDGYREADIVLELVVENIEKQIVLMISTIVNEKRAFIERIDDKEALQRARTYALKTKDGAYYGISDGKEVHIKAIDPDVFLDEIKPIGDLKSIIEMIIKEERRIKESSDFIDYLKEKHNEIEVYMERRLIEKLKDKKYEEKIRQFLAPIGMSYSIKEDIPDETLKMLSMQATYLLIDKILFYYLIIENKENLRKGFGDKEKFDEIFRGLIKEPPLSEELNLEWAKKFWNYLEKLFKLIQEIDYEPIFSTINSPLNEINLDEHPNACYNLKELMGFLYKKEKLSNLFDGPLLSKIYEGLIPSDLRWKWGQIYTPPEITRFIAEWAIRNPNDLVLDPACGTGRFLISAYEHLLKLKGGNRNKIHQELLYQIRGIDINQFPAHLATMSLAAMNLDSITRYVNISVMDFLLLEFSGQSIFDLSKIKVQLTGQTEFGEKGRLVGQTSFSKDTKIDDPIGLVDAIIMNPPYTRQEALSKKYKNRFIEKTLSGLSPTKKIQMSNRASYYSYFIVQGTKFLKDNGRFGMIVQNSWLDVDYGKDIQKFLLDYYCIKAIIGTEKHRLIQTADVNTVLVLVERETQKNKRDNNSVRFVQLKKNINWFEKNYQFDNLLEIIEKNENLYIDDLRIISKSQKELEMETDKAGKWGNFIRAPNIYFNILDRIKNKLIPLEEIAEIRFGIKTGANDFFYLPIPGKFNKFFEGKFDEKTGNLLLFVKDKKYVKIFTKQGFEIKEPMFQIEKEYWMHKDNSNMYKFYNLYFKDNNNIWLPNYVIKSPKEITKNIIELENLNFVALMIDSEKYHLKGSIMEYIKWGEKFKPEKEDNYNLRPTCKSRKRWYELGSPINDTIICRMTINEKYQFIYNPLNLYIDARFYGIKISIISEIEKFISLLNSTLYFLQIELAGRTNLGEGALDVKVYEYGELMIPTPSIFEEYKNLIPSINEININSSIYKEIDAIKPENVSLERINSDRREIDKIVLGKILGLNEFEQFELYRGAIKLVNDRLEKAKKSRSKEKRE